MLHKRLLLAALYYGARWRIRKLLGLSSRNHLPVMESGINQAVERHSRICRTLLPYLTKYASVPGARIAEIGCGDCLAVADMLLALGAKNIHLVESNPILVTPAHKAVAKAMSEQTDLPNRGDVFDTGNSLKLNFKKVTLHSGFLESIELPAPVDIICSFDVLEHVEDLEGFFKACKTMLKSGGVQIHKFDLSGHEFFEDPIPPLDFQTYPTWLFNLVFPKYRRAAGHFADEIFTAMQRSGLMIEQVVSLRSADPDYLDTVWPKLRHEARQRSKQTVAMLDVVVVAKSI